MKLLILSCSTGEGHNSAGKALLEYLEGNGVACEMTDTLSLVTSPVSQMVSDVYLFSTRRNLFKTVYRMGETVSTGLSLQSPVYMANKLYAKRLYDYIVDNGFDTVVCTHLFPAEALTALKRAGRLDRKTVFVMTDYTCIPFTRETVLDYYIVPHEHLVEECVQKGLRRERLFPFGIPVRRAFRERIAKREARVACAAAFDSGADMTAKWFLVASGSMGFGSSADLIREILSRCGKGAEVFMVCGNNAKLQTVLKAEFGRFDNIHLLGFTDRMSLLMDACDVLFTKPGGLSSTEAAVKNIPIVHTAPIPGCETRNAEFFHYHGMSYSSLEVKQQVTVALRLCNDDAYRQRICDSQRTNADGDACRRILELLRR